MPTDDGRLGVLLVSFASVGGQAHQKTMYLPVLARIRRCAWSASRTRPRRPRSSTRSIGARPTRSALTYHAGPRRGAGRSARGRRVGVLPVRAPRGVLRARRGGGQARARGQAAGAQRSTSATRSSARSRRADVVCMPAYHYRFHPAIRSARAAVTGGSVGLPWAVQAEFIIAAGTAAWPLGELLNFGLYSVDAIRAILGLEVESVYATVGLVLLWRATGRTICQRARAEFRARGGCDDVRRTRADHRASERLRRRSTRARSWARTARSSWTRRSSRSACTATEQAELRGYGDASLRLLVDHLVDCVRSEPDSRAWAA